MKFLKYLKHKFSRVFLSVIGIKRLNKIIRTLEVIKITANYGNSNTKLNNLFQDRIVYSGPFKGMVYPEFISHGSALYSKLIGCYESELQVSIENLMKNKYDTVIDIGCAEGYYAVGMAIRQPQAKIYAIDVNQNALNSCMKMAKCNNVDDRMNLVTFCDIEILSGMISGRTLIVSDCEGYEFELFTDKSIGNFRSCDLLIELHDNENSNISGTMKQLFNSTHTYEHYYSMSDELKLYVQDSKFGFEIIKGFDSKTQYQAITDLRAICTEWIVCKSTKN